MLFHLHFILFYHTLFNARDKILFFFINNILFDLLPAYGLVYPMDLTFLGLILHIWKKLREFS